MTLIEKGILVFFVILSLECKPEKPTIPIKVDISQQRKSVGDRELVVAKIGEREITVGEIEDRLKALPVYVRLRYTSPERKREFVESYIQYQVLSLVAEQEGYTDDPRVQAFLKSDLVERYLASEVDSKVQSSDIPESEVASYYKTHYQEFNRPAQLRISHILIKDKEKAMLIGEKVRKMVSLDTSDQVAVFTRLVLRYSEDEMTKKIGGDLGFFPRIEKDQREVPKEVEEAISKMNNLFEVSEVITAEDGYHILFVSEKRDGISLSLEEAKSTILSILMEEERKRRRQEFIKSLMEKADVQINRDIFNQALATLREKE